MILNHNGSESVLQFSTRNGLAFRNAGQHFGISGNGTVISYFDFCNGGCVRRVSVSGVGQLAGDFSGEDFFDINNQGVISFSLSGQVLMASVRSPFNATIVANGDKPRLADGTNPEVVFIQGGQVVSSVGGVVHTGIWADVDDSGNIVFEDVLGGSSQIFVAKSNKPPMNNLGVFSGDIQSLRPSKALLNPLTVKVTDQSGNAVSGTTISFQITQQPANAMGASLSTAMATSVHDGTAATQLTFGDQPGQYQVTASCPNNDCTPNEVVFTETAIGSAVLVDPVTQLLNGPSVITVANGANVLATNGRLVQGVTADGVTQVLVRIPAGNIGDQFLLALDNDLGLQSGSEKEDGGLGVPGDQGFSQSQITVAAVDTSQGPMAFAIYRAPIDFPRVTRTSDASAASRPVSIQIQSIANGTTQSLTVVVARPAVVLVHGIWADPSSWDSFVSLVGNPLFFIRRANYSQPLSGITGFTPGLVLAPKVAVSPKANSLGFAYNAPTVLKDIQRAVYELKSGQTTGIPIAAVQADVVAHSMGGDITRTLPLESAWAYFTYDTFGKGNVHKLITIDTPHLGTPFATDGLQNDNFCVRSVIANAGDYAFSVVDFGASSALGAVGDTFKEMLSGAPQG